MQAIDKFKLLANQNRMLIINALQIEMCVEEITLNTGVAQPTLSQQLTILRKNKVVETRRDGKRIYYKLADHRILDLLLLAEVA